MFYEAVWCETFNEILVCLQHDIFLADLHSHVAQFAKYDTNSIYMK